MSRLPKLSKIILGVGAVGGTVYYFYLSDANKKVAFTSWTTGYTPSVTTKWDNNWDYRSPKALVHPKASLLSNEKDDNQKNEAIESKTPTATRHLLLIRHGQYNISGNSDEERTLTKLGRIQAELTGVRLKSLGIPYTNLVKSSMTRALETGAIINAAIPEVPCKECHLLREGAPVPPEPPVGHWRPAIHDGARIEAAFRQYFHRAEPSQEKDTVTILVCHANVIRYFVCRALQFPSEAWLRMSLNHASVTWISITPRGRVILRTLGDSGHLPPDMITS